MTSLVATTNTQDAPSGLISVESIKGVQLIWTPPSTNTALYNAFEVWGSNGVNNRASATKLGETREFTFWHTGLTTGDTWYYWVRAAGQYGLYSAWEPSSATGGVEEIVGYVDANDLDPSIELPITLSTSSSTTTFNNSTYNAYQALATLQFSGTPDYEVIIGGELFYDWSTNTTVSGTQSVFVRLRLRNETTSTDVGFPVDMELTQFSTAGVQYAQKFIAISKNYKLTDDDTYKFYVEVQKYRTDGTSTLTISSTDVALNIRAKQD